MANPTDGAGKGPQKPTPIIDLKATEVRVDAAGKDAGKDPSKPGAAAASSSSPAAGAAKPSDPKSVSSTASSSGVPNIGGKPSDPKATDPKAADPKASSSTTAASSAASAAASAKPTASAAPANGAPKAPSEPASRAADQRRGGGVISTLTHMVAGLAGGVLALFGAETIQTQLGVPINLPRPQADAATVDLSRRVAAVETAARQAPAGDAAQKLAAAERRIADLEQVAKTVAELGARQTALAATAKDLEGKLGAAGGQTALPAEMADRLGKLEQSLATLSRAAGADGQGGGRIAQLAQISGKLTDLESSVSSQMAALRKSVMSELETRVAQTAEASEAARSGTQRLDRDLATLKTEAARLQQRGETLRATDERFDKTLRVVQEETGTLKSSLDELKGDLLQQLKSVARPKDVSAALAPVNTKIAGIEKDLAGVVKSETDRKVNAERVVLALELANLKRVVERGGSYAKELAELKASAGAKLDLAALDKFKDKGVPTTPELSAEFRSLAHQMIAAADERNDASVVDRLLSGAKSIVKVRSTNPSAADTSAEATIARIEARLKDGSLAAALDEAAKLPAKAKQPAAGWLERVGARAEIERAIAGLEAQLKASLGGGAATKSKG